MRRFITKILTAPPFLPLYVYTHLHCTWQQPVVFAGEERNKTALVKISLRQNFFSLKLPGEVCDVEDVEALQFCREAF